MKLDGEGLFSAKSEIIYIPVKPFERSAPLDIFSVLLCIKGMKI